MEKQETTKKTFPFFRILRTNLLLMALITILVTLLGTLYGIMFVKPTYTVSRSVILRTELGVNSENAESTNAALAELVIVQLEDHFTSAKYIEMANEEFKKKNPLEKSYISAGAISVDYSEDSLIFKLKYTDINKDLASKKLVAVYDSAIEYFENISTAYTVKLIPTDNTGIDNSRFGLTVDNGMKKTILLSVVIGLALAVGVACIRYALDNTVHDKEDLEELTGTSVLAYVFKSEQ